MVTMHKQFPTWMSEFELGANDEARQRRWDGVAQISENADKNEVEALVRLAFKTRHKPTCDAVRRIIGTFGAVDPERPVEDGSREMQVLAGASLIAILNCDDQDIAAVAALAITTASLIGSRTLNLPIDLVGEAERCLQSLANLNGNRPDLKNYVASPAINVNFDAASAKYQQQPDPNGMAAAFKAAGDVTRAALQGVMKNQQAAIEATAKIIAQQDEELQMLWWLIGGRSWEFDCPFDNVVADAQPLVFAKELADQTTLLPGPISIKSLLSRAGVRTKETTLANVVGGANADWLDNLVRDLDPSPVTLPIHLAIKRQLEVGTGDAWVPSWAGAVEVPQHQTYLQLALAESFYRERLLLSAMK
jgi:hypothetical protein